MTPFAQRSKPLLFVLALLAVSNLSFWLPSGYTEALSPANTRAPQQRHMRYIPPIPRVSQPQATAMASLSVSARGSAGGIGSSAKQIPPSFPPSPASTADRAKTASTTEILRESAPAFIENRGQFDEHVRYRLSEKGGSVWLADKGLVFDFLRTGSLKAKAELNNQQGVRLNSVGQAEANLPANLAIPTTAERLVFDEEFLDSNPNMTIEASDPAKWQTNTRASLQTD